MKGGFTSHSLRRGMVAVSVAGGIGMMLVAFALAFSNAASAREIAESSQELQWANATAGASAVGRAALNQALVFTVDVALGVAKPEAAQIAREEAKTTLETLSSFAAGAPDESRSELDEVEELIEIGFSALGLMEEDNIREADTVLTRDFEPAYVVATASLRERQEAQAARINNAASSAGRTENITRLIVTLLIPAAAIIIHQLIIRRQYREREVHMEAQVEAERELNRSKDQFIAGISHELRTPLTSIYGFSEHLLESGFVDPTESLELITMINDDSAELSRMVDDLLAAARIDAEAIWYEIDPLELKGEVEHLVEQYRRSGTSIDVVGARTIGLADRSRLRQVLRNLISNAERHGGDNVEVDVSVFEGQAAIRVIDDGPGVSGDMYERLFTRFVHEPTDTLTSGSVGLGLAIARQMARDMGGDINYERTLGLTVFTVFLPLAAADALPVPRTEVPDAQYYDGKADADVIDIASAAEAKRQPEAQRAVVMFE
ncbi:MAG: HAMP domain-containing histidine kinase, partial [Acidimicrobiia bacterium]|nr:HAMP domain-containing histidine kinase [Acidimicrobiia bacterium]